MSVPASNNNVIDQNDITDSNDSLATAASAAQIRPPISARFLIALATLVSQGAILIICQSCAVSSSSIVYGFGVLLTIFTTFFASEVRILFLSINAATFQWIWIHSFALTHQNLWWSKHPWNLSTACPNSWTSVCCKNADASNPAPRPESEKAAFNATRDAVSSMIL